MPDVRDPNAMLTPYEIEAVKATQEIIKRMADDSAKAKTTFMAVTAALLAFVKPEVSWMAVGTVLSYLCITVALWYTDAKYLQLERAFRLHHNAIINGSLGSLNLWAWKVGGLLKQCESVRSIMLHNFTMWLYWIASGVSIALLLFLLWKLDLAGSLASVLNPLTDMAKSVVVRP